MIDNYQQILNIWCPYVPPEKPKLMEELCNHINRKMSENTILVGDLNAKSYQWNNGNENSHGWFQANCSSTSGLIWSGG
jgi:endonuclease/exonuclease/phosphatase family metal-dependent hydrolase